MVLKKIEMSNVTNILMYLVFKYLLNAEEIMEL